MPRPTEDLTGKVYGRLTVLQFVGFLQVGTRPQRAAFWECQCECGNIVQVRANALKGDLTKSCGCLASETMSKTGKRNALPEGVAAANYVYGRYRYSAKKRGHQFTLSFEEATELFKLPCHYCGDLPSQTAYKDWYHGEFVYNGIDRVDSKFGYIPGNCVPCCGRCNYAKHEGSAEEFKAWIKRAYEHLF